MGRVYRRRRDPGEWVEGPARHRVPVSVGSDCDLALLSWAAMDERHPDNLKLLHDAFGEGAIDSILPGDTFTVDGVEFVCKYTTGSTAERFYIVKSLDLVERYRQMCERFRGGNIVELGIAEGGGAAFIALVAEPHRLCAVDLEPVPLAALAEFSARHGLSDVLRTYWGIDQSDGDRLGAAMVS